MMRVRGKNYDVFCEVSGKVEVGGGVKGRGGRGSD